MKNRNRLPAMLLALALCLSLSACAGEGGGETPAPSDGIAVDLTQDILAFSAGLSAGDALLTVDGVEMPADLVLYLLYMNCSYLEAYYTGQTVAGSAEKLLEDTVELCRYYTLLRRKAAELGCPPTDAQMESARQAMMAEGQDGYDLRKTLYGLTDDSMEYIFTIGACQDNLMDAVVPAATEELLNDYVYQARHILLLTVDMEGQPVQREDGSYAWPPLDGAVIAQRRATAEDLLARLRAADDPEGLFNELMNEYSQDSGLAANPDGYTATPGVMVPEFERAAFALDFGEISDIVESSYGYHILLRGRVEDLDSYTEGWRGYMLDRQVDAWLEQVRSVPAPALEELDAAGFYVRYTAYQQAVLAGREDEGGEGAQD